MKAMSSNRNTFRPLLESLGSRVVPAVVARPWGEWSPIYQASAAVQVQQPEMQRPSQPTTSGDVFGVTGPAGLGDRDGGHATPSLMGFISRPGPIPLPKPVLE
jgi:hypothetical protein